MKRPLAFLAALGPLISLCVILFLAWFFRPGVETFDTRLDWRPYIYAGIIALHVWIAWFNFRSGNRLLDTIATVSRDELRLQKLKEVGTADSDQARLAMFEQSMRFAPAIVVLMDENGTILGFSGDAQEAFNGRLEVGREFAACFPGDMADLHRKRMQPYLDAPHSTGIRRVTGMGMTVLLSVRSIKVAGRMFVIGVGFDASEGVR